MKTLNEILSDKRFLGIGYQAYNLQVYKKGSHNASMISGMGRCFCETKNKRVVADRMEVGQSDVFWIYQYIGFSANSKFKTNKPELDFYFSNSGATLYLRLNKDIYEAILEALLIYPKPN